LSSVIVSAADANPADKNTAVTTAPKINILLLYIFYLPLIDAILNKLFRQSLKKYKYAFPINAG